MLDIVQFIQHNVLRDRSAIIKPLLTSIVEGVIKEVGAFHDWRCLYSEYTVPLETNTENYVLSGADQNLDRIYEMWYGEDEDPVEEYSNREFRERVLGQLSQTTPFCFVPKGRSNNYSWNVRIYPCSATSFDTLTYSYKRLIRPTEIALFSDQMVFVNGTLAYWFAKEKEFIKSAKCMDAYLMGREVMKAHDGPTVHPRSRIALPKAALRARVRMKLLSDRRPNLR